MGFYTEDVFVPLGMYGPVATLTSSTLRLEELYTCNYVHISDEDNSNPTKLTFNIFLSSVKLITSIPTLIQRMINTVKKSYLKN